MQYLSVNVFESPTALLILDHRRQLPQSMPCLQFLRMHTSSHNWSTITNMDCCTNCSLNNVRASTLNGLKTKTFEIKCNVNIVRYNCKTKGCSSTWYVCDGSCVVAQQRRLRNQRFGRKGNLLRHMKLYHPAQVLDIDNTNTARQENGSDSSDSMAIDFSNPFGDSFGDHDHAVDQCFDDNPPIEVVEQKFINPHLNEYLELVKSNGYFPAVSRLVCRAAFSCKLTGKDQADSGRIPAAWIRLFLNIAVLVTARHEQKQPKSVVGNHVVRANFCPTSSTYLLSYSMFGSRFFIKDKE